jgi:hypothetical protein
MRSCSLSPSSSSSGTSTPPTSIDSPPCHALVLPSSREKLSYARQVILREAAALSALADRIDEAEDGAALSMALDLVARLPPYGKVVITGVGKSLLVGRKASATFCSLGAFPQRGLVMC